jgi:hypothetical protein
MLQVAFEREATSSVFLYFEFCFDLEIKLHRAPKFCKTHSIPDLNLASVGGGWWEAVGCGWRCFHRSLDRLWLALLWLILSVSVGVPTSPLFFSFFFNIFIILIKLGFNGRRLCVFIPILIFVHI